MARLPPLDVAALRPEQRRVHDLIASGPRGAVEGPLLAWLASPELAERAQALGAFCRYHTSLPSRLTELAILVTGAHWHAGFEWFVHAPIAIEAGIHPDTVEAIRTGRAPDLSDPEEAAVYAFARQLVHGNDVSDLVYGQAEGLLGTKAVIELVGVLGYYALISMTIVACRIPLPPGKEDPFASPGHRPSHGAVPEDRTGG